MGYKPGQSGNPAGRPPGIPTKAGEYRRLLESYAPDLIRKAAEMALAGDSTALRVCMDKLMPNLKHVELDADVRHSLDDWPLAALERRHADLVRQLEDLRAHPQGRPSASPDTVQAMPNPPPPH